MIDLYTWSTPNGRKASIMLEELGEPYETHPIDIMADAQHAPDYLAISPNNKIPAIVDRAAGISLFESGAILLYLAEKHDRLLPKSEAGRWAATEWLMWQMGGFGPMLGQAHHFLHFNKGKAAYAEERYAKEAARLYGVLDRRLGAQAYLAGDEYSLADIAAFPWATHWEWQGVNLAAHPNVLRWYREIAGRDAVRRGYAVPKPAEIPAPPAAA
ncbi:MAG: glutathione S-transferase N-terminal domain-containing protein [Pseudomonadota bacterium]